MRKLIIVVFWLAVLLSAGLATLSLAIKYSLPYLDYYRPQIEKNLTQITGYPVTLQRIHGQLIGLDPVVSIDGLQLLNDEQAIVAIDALKVRMDTLKSLLTLSPQFTYVRFVKPQIALQERQGQWQLKGARNKANGNAGVALERVLDYFASQQYLAILDASVTLDSDELGQHILRMPNGDIFQQQRQTLLTTEFFLDDEVEAFKLDAKLANTLSVLDDYRIELALHVPKIALPSSMSIFKQLPELAAVELGGDLWLDFLLGKDMSLQLETSALEVAFKNGDQYQLKPSIKAKYNAKKPHLRVDVNNLRFATEAQTSAPTYLSFDWSATSQRSTLRFDQVDLQAANTLALQMLPADWTAAKILSGLAPRGTAKNAALSIWQEEGEWAFQYLSNLQDSAINGYSGIPQADHIDAVFSLTQQDGAIEFSGNASQIAFADLYTDVWSTEQLRGHVQWQQQASSFVVKGQDLQVLRNGADIQGGFRLEVRNDEADWLALDLHAQNLDLKDRLTYLPDGALDEDIINWIDTAFTSPAKVPNLDIMLHSELQEGSRPHVRLAMDIRDTQIAFDPNWPVAKRVNGHFDLDQQGIHIKVASATMDKLSVRDISIDVPLVADQTPWLNIKGQVSAEAGIIMDYLHKTPLAESILTPFEQWQVSGKLTGDVDLSVPFDPELAPKVTLGISFANNNLHIGEIDLAAKVSRGQFHYNSVDGIHDSQFDLTALGGDTRLVLSSNAATEEVMVIEGQLDGRVDIKKVASWSIVPLPSIVPEKLTGQVAYQGKLAINKSQQGQFDLAISSDLLGAEIDFPVPLGKKPDQPLAYDFKFMQHNTDMVVDDSFGGLVRSRMLLRDGEFVGGEVLLNKEQTFAPEIPKGLAIKGEIEHLDINAWDDIVQAFIDYTSPQGQEVSAGSILDIPTWLSQLDIIIDGLVINPDNTLHNVKLGYPVNQALRFNSDEMNFELSQINGQPDLHFNFLSWNLSADESADGEEAANEAFIKSEQIPDMTLAIDKLYIDNSPYGDWRTKIVRDGNRVRLTNIESALKTGKFDGSLFWQDQGERSNVALNLSIQGKDLAELTQKFSDQAFVTSKNYNINVVLSWQGHPFHFDRPSVSGRIGFAAEDGSFTQVEELPAFLKVLGIFNVGALSRRLSLDFTDVYEPGLSYDDFTGDMVIDKGILTTTKPITIISPTAELFVEGSANLVEETLNERMTASFPISGTLPLAGLLWGTPQIAGLLFITDRLFGNQISKVTSVRYDVTGTFDEPVLTPVKYQPSQASKRGDR